MYFPSKIFEKCFFLVCFSLIFCITLWTISLNNFDDNYITINIDTHPFPVNIISEKFLSFGLDTSEIVDGVESLNLTSSKLLRLASSLSPGYLRLGGTLSDRLIFILNQTEDTDVTRYGVGKFLPFFTMDSDTWLKINDFCNATNLKLLFDFNALLRDDNKWQPDNAIELLKFSRQHNLNIDWQLGNEPNSFAHVFNITVSPWQMAQDFKTLKNQLIIYYPESLLVGPDSTRPQPKRPSCVEYMKEFLSEASDYVDAMAWHQYYLNGRIATLEDFWEPDVMDLLQSQIDTMVMNTEIYQKKLKMWLTETSSAYGGGAPGLSNSFASSPLWLDKLGTAARNGIQVVVRQSLIGANYSLIDKNLDPLPDWWISYLFKLLVGRQVISCSLNASKYQRFYCHCASENLNIKNSVVIYGMNLGRSSVNLGLSGSAVNYLTDIDEYVLTAPNSDRKSKDILLNGVLLSFKDEIPNVEPRRLGPTKSFLLPPYSLGFWVLKNTDMPFC